MITELGSPFFSPPLLGNHLGKFPPPMEGLQRKTLSPTSCSCPNECFSRGSETTGTFSRALRHVFMCWPVWENPKGVFNLFNRNIKQAPATHICKEQAGKQREAQGLPGWHPGPLKRAATPCDPPADGRQLSWGTPTPSPTYTSPSMNFLYWSPDSHLGLLGQLSPGKGLEFLPVTWVRGSPRHPLDKFFSRLSGGLICFLLS